MQGEAAAAGTEIETDVPARLDRLPWSRWHRRVVIALGITWVLDGLEASLVANLGTALHDPRTLGLTGTEVGVANSLYLVGQVAGALVFGRLTDRFGRKRLFLVTLGLYLFATAASGLSPNFWVFLFFRVFAGAGIGGEYAAINSAIDELIPARVRGQVDLGINGSYWLGVILGALLTMLLLHGGFVPLAIAWRLAFGLGAVIGLVILFVRRDVPESPRWLLMHGHAAAAAEVIGDIERRAGVADAAPAARVRLRVTGTVTLGHVARVLFAKHRRRTALGLVLMIAQAFFYNAIFFSYELILARFYGVTIGPIYMVPFAIGNFLGPLVLGRFFDSVGRRRMMAITYSLSGLLLVVTGALFYRGVLDAVTQTVCWCVVFFFASSAASSAYLTVSELFPVELRGMAIALFYAVGTAVGAAGPTVFGAIVESGDRGRLFAGYAFASALMLAAGVVAFTIGVDAEGRSLEELV
jgi:MFS family permease